MKSTRPAFVVGSGRSGTRALYKSILGMNNVEVHHEFACVELQRLGAMRYMGLHTPQEISKQIQELYGSALYWTPSKVWIDCSNKATWLISDLALEYPNARFLNVVRDGRKVALSYFKKLGSEMYDDFSVSVMQRWLSDTSTPKPPLEKRFWWNIPQRGQPFHHEFPSFDQFQRAAYHWVVSNEEARKSLSSLSPEHAMTVKLEELVVNSNIQQEVCDFLGVPFTSSFSDSLSKPKNVIVPVDYVLTPRQRAQFNEIGAKEMESLGYDVSLREERVVY